MRRIVARFLDHDRASLFPLLILIGLNLYDNGNGSIKRSEPADCQSVEAFVRHHAMLPPIDRVLNVQPTLIRFHFDKHLGDLAETGRDSQKTKDRTAEAVIDRMSINSQMQLLDSAAKCFEEFVVVHHAADCAVTWPEIPRADWLVLTSTPEVLSAQS